MLPIGGNSLKAYLVRIPVLLLLLLLLLLPSLLPSDTQYVTKLLRSCRPGARFAWIGNNFSLVDWTMTLITAVLLAYIRA
jgi:hypothetical protein